MESLNTQPVFRPASEIIRYSQIPFEGMRLAESTLPPNLDSFDFSPSEMKFLKRIGGSCGSFVMNDYRTWRKGKAGAIDQAFLEKLKRYRFCSVSPGPGYQRIDLVSKPFFRLIEMENSRIRRHQGRARPKALLCSAYLSQCPHRVLITPKEEVKIVTTQLFVADSVIPKTIYRGRSGLSTVQYFPERFPMFVRRAERSALDPEPILGVVYVDDPECSHSRFNSFLQRNSDFLAAIRRLHFVYVGANYARCEMARVKLQQFGKFHENPMKVDEQRSQEAKRRAHEEAQQRAKAWERFCGLHRRAMKDDFAWSNNDFTFYGECVKTFGKDARERLEQDLQAGRTPHVPPMQGVSEQLPKSPPKAQIHRHYWTAEIYKPNIRLSPSGNGNSRT